MCHKMADNRLEQMKDELVGSLDAALTKLHIIWDEIGIHEEMRRDRTSVVLLHLRNLLEEMVREEEALKNKLMVNVEHFGERLLKLSQELHLPPHEPKEHLSVLQLEKELRTHVDNLEQEKHERFKKLKELTTADQHLCDIMSTTPYYIPSGLVPKQEQLKELEEHITNLTAEKVRRRTIYKTTKENISKMFDDLEEEPNTSFERDILCEEDDSFLLSNDNMRQLKRLHDNLELRQKENFSLASSLRDRVVQLWERLEIPEENRNEFNTQHTGFKPKTIHALKDEIARCELLKLENMQRVIEGARKELDEWWDKCFTSSEERKLFTAYYTDDFTEEILELHDTEVNRIKQVYNESQDMFEKVARRQRLWLEFLEFERKASDPNRFFNRGCNLLKEEKARKKIVKELPKVEAEVKDYIEQWEKQSGKEFLIGGQRFTDHVQRQWEEYQVQKENEKTQRKVAKDKETEEEMLFGSKPTPGKRRFVGTPGKTPTKLRKFNETSSKTPRSASRMMRTNHTSVFSPACMPPRSTSKTPHRPQHAQERARKALGDKTSHSNETLFSHTTVSSAVAGQSIATSSSDSSLASVGQYNDFARGLNTNARPNCRSSVMPKAYF